MPYAAVRVLGSCMFIQCVRNKWGKGTYFNEIGGDPMKVLKQLFRQPGKTLAGILLILLATAILCTSVGQAAAAASTEAALNEQFTTVALPTLKYQQKEIDGWPVFERKLPYEIADWMEKTAADNPDLVKTIASPGLASAYISSLRPEHYTAHPYFPYTWISNHKEMLPLPNGAPYSCAMLEVKLDEIIGTPEISILDLSFADWLSEVSSHYSVILKGTIEKVIGLGSDFPNPEGFSVYLTLEMPDKESFDGLDLQIGETYLTYGMDYFDWDWWLRQCIRQEKNMEIEAFQPDKFQYPTKPETTGNEAQKKNPDGEIVAYYDGIGLSAGEMKLVHTISLTLKDENILKGCAEAYRMPTITKFSGGAEAFLNSEDGVLWKETLERIEINNQAFPVIGVENINYLADFARAEARIVTGRDFTSSELNNGEKVCLLSQSLASANGISVGDTIPVRYYNYDWDSPYQTYLESGRGIVNPTACFYTATTPFAGETEYYTVVGLYRNQEWADPDENLYSFTPNTIFVPKTSVTGSMDFGNQGLFRTLVLNNGSLSDFLALTAQAGYEGLFTCSDQGYSEIAGSLYDFCSAANRMLWIGASLSGIMVLLYLFLFPMQQNKNLFTMGSLGASRKERILYLVQYSSAILFPGVILGWGTSMLLCQKVTQALMASAESVIAVDRNTGVLVLTAIAALTIILFLNLLLAVPMTKQKQLMKKR